MATLKARMIDEVIEREGDYSDNPADRGGPTRFGITQRTARDHGYHGDMVSLPRALAVDIYAGRYWNSLCLDSIEPISNELAEYLFDYGVNSGPQRAAAELQTTLNTLNDQQRHYRDMRVDGVIGPLTLGALAAFQLARGSEGLRVLAQTINACRIAYCRDLAIHRRSQEAFAYGWFRRVVELSAGAS